MARIVVEGPINGATRKRVLKALKEVADREFPALLLRIDSPGARSVTARKFTPPFFACVKRGVGLLPASATFQLRVGSTSA